MSELAETLRSQTKQARQRISEEAETFEQQRKTDDKTAKRRLAGRIGAFVRTNTKPSIENLELIASQGADRGHSEVEKVWRIPEEKPGEPTEELMKHRALSARVAQHFVELGMVSEVIDDRYSVTEPHPDGGTITTDTDYRIGVRVSWETPAQLNNG